MIVVWRITQRCNLRCKFCAYDRELSWARRDADPAQVLAFGRVLGEYARASGRRVMVSWLGGEPLLWQPLSQLTLKFRRDFGLQISTTTNGTSLISATTRRHLLQAYAELTISVDGISSVHDESRGWRGGFETLRRSVTALAEEKRHAGGGPLLRANVILLRNTVRAFPRLCRELAEWGIEEISYNQLGGNDRPEFYPVHRLLPEQVAWFADNVADWRAELAARGLRLLGGAEYLHRFAASAAGVPLAVENCPIGDEFLFITEAGRVAPCSFTPDEFGVALGEITTVDALRALPARFRIAQRSRRAAPCADCQSTQMFDKFAA